MSKFEKLYRSREVILEVLMDRGYEVGEDSLTFEEFEEMYSEYEEKDLKEELTLRYEKEDDENSKIVVVWLKDPKLGTNIRDVYQDYMEEDDYRKAIIIVDESVIYHSRDIIKNLRSQKIYIDVYTLLEAQTNIMKHLWVPRHEICTKKEKKKLMKQYSVTADQLPHIKLTDPCVRHLGAVKGDLLRITRESETSKGSPSLSYRLVV